MAQADHQCNKPPTYGEIGRLKCPLLCTGSMSLPNNLHRLPAFPCSGCQPLETLSSNCVLTGDQQQACSLPVQAAAHTC